MPKVIPSPRCDDLLGIGSWRADDDSSRREKQSTPAFPTPDLGRGNSGVPRPTGPPGSAPPWNEHEDGRCLAAPSGKGEAGVLFASTRSRDVLHKAWGEITTEGSNAISKATFILVHVEVHRRVDHGESTTRPESGSATCDLRSDAEMNWATSSKGRTVMDLQQFQQACLAMANGLGVTADASRYGTFCCAVLEACRAIGEHQKVNRPSTRPPREGLSSPSALPPDSPLRGSFPPGFDQASDPDESGRWLLRSARPPERERQQEQQSRREAEPENAFGLEPPPRQGRQRQQQATRSAEKAATMTSGEGSIPSRAQASATVGGGSGGGGGEESGTDPAARGSACGDRPVLVMQRAESCRSWPPAWVKQSAPKAVADQDSGDGDGGAGAIVLARGLFAAKSPPPSTATAAGPQMRSLDSRLLMGSVSQKALLLQEELRNDRARLLELQRNSGRGQTAWLPCRASPPPSRSPPASPPREDRDGKQPALRRSATAEVGGDESSGGYCCGLSGVDTSGHPRHPRPRLAPAAQRLVGGGAVTAAAAAAATAAAKATAPPPDALSCAVLGHRFSNDTAPTAASGGASEWGGAGAVGAGDGTGSLGGGSVDVSLSTGSSSSGAGMSGFGSRAPKVVPPKEKVIILPCRLCRTRESALWCAECKLSFCAICFAKVPHHQGTGLLLHDHDAAQGSSSRPQESGSRLPSRAAASRRAESSGKRDPEAPSSCRHPAPRQQEAEASTRLGRLQRGRPHSFPLAARNPSPELATMEMEGLRTGGAKKGRRKSRRETALLEEKLGRQVAVLPQDELAAFRSIPALCLNSGSDGLCSARDFHNNKYALAAAKAVSPRELPLDFSRGKGRYNYCGGPLKDDGVDGKYDDDRRGTAGDGRITGGGVGGAKGVKTFGGTSVRVVVQ
eukprot:g8481.t1